MSVVVAFGNILQNMTISKNIGKILDLYIEYCYNQLVIGKIIFHCVL